MLAKVWRVIEWVLIAAAICIVLSIEWVNNWQARRAARRVAK